MKPRLIEDIEERTKNRKKAKQKYDAAIALATTKSKGNTICLASTASGQRVRLLDEGTVVSSDGYPLFYIKRGTIQSYYETLSSDYVGSINVGHQNFATFPFLVGEWTKDNLTVVDIGNGRKGLDVDLVLDESSVFVKELRRLDYAVGVSAEFAYTVDFENSETLGLEVLDSINIMNFGIVGEAGNVNSSDIVLGGINLDAFKKLMEKVLGTIDKEGCSCDGECKCAAKDADDAQNKLEAKEGENPKANGQAGEDGKENEQEGVDSEENDEAQLAEFFTKFDKTVAALEEMTSRAKKAEAALAAKEKSDKDMMSRFAKLSSEFLKKQETEKAALEEKKEAKKPAYAEISEDGMGVL